MDPTLSPAHSVGEGAFGVVCMRRRVLYDRAKMLGRRAFSDRQGDLLRAISGEQRRRDLVKAGHG